MRVVCFQKIEEENGYMNSWYYAPFYLDGEKFWCCEQYVLYRKALMFNDSYHGQKILASTDKTEIQNYAKEIKNYVDKVWNARRCQVIYRANMAKFQQNIQLKQQLLSTGDNVIASIGKNDKVWGLGLNKEDTRIYNMAKWDGLNLLGFTLMEVRETLKFMD